MIRFISKMAFTLLGVAATRLERAMGEERGRCRQCGSAQFTIDNWDDPVEAGTVEINPEGQVLYVEGMISCAHCGEIWLSDSDEEVAKRLANDVPHLRVVE